MMHSVTIVSIPTERFFEVAPTRVIAALRLCPHEEVTPPEVQVTDGYNPGKERRSPTRLAPLGIPVGAELVHLDGDEKETAVVVSVSPDRIRHEDEEGSLSALAARIHKRYYPNANDSIQGAAHWQYQGKTLWDLRIELEKAQAEEDDC